MSDALHPSNYERSDADPRLIGSLAVGIAIFLVATPFLLRAIYPGSSRDHRVVEGRLPPEPRLQVAAKADLDGLHAAENERLERYGWVDRDRSVVRIPIERAMKLLSERGLPGWLKPPEKPADAPPR